MDWMEIVVHTNTEGAELVSELLMQEGAGGTMTEDRADVPDPSKPNGYWEIIDPAMIEAMPEDVLVHAWLPSDASLQERLSRLQERLGALRGCGSLTIDTAEVRDTDWNKVWRRFYKPFRAGKTLVVKPTWEEYTPQPGDRVIEMDPGMAFGSGTHETTGMCLALLEEAVHGGEKVIDVGTGSGILAIGAALLGAGDVLAVDIDPDAVKVARENVAHNGLRIRVEQGNLLESSGESCDICVANIIADVICAFAAPLLDHIRPGGVFICSGIIREREEDVRAALLAAGYDIRRVLHRGEWTAMLAGRP